jgi:hypothetical protein
MEWTVIDPRLVYTDTTIRTFGRRVLVDMPVDVKHSDLSVLFKTSLTQRTRMDRHMGQKKPELRHHTPHDDLLEVPHKRTVTIEYVMITDDQSFMPVQSLKDFRPVLMTIPEEDISEMINLILRSDIGIPILDHRLVHLSDVVKRASFDTVSILELQDIRVIKVRIACKKDFSQLLSPHNPLKRNRLL